MKGVHLRKYVKKSHSSIYRSSNNAECFFKTFSRVTTMWLQQRPKPQGSPSSNRKHLFRSDNSAACLWGPDIKRITKDDVGRKRDADREREGTRPRRGRQMTRSEGGMTVPFVLVDFSKDKKRCQKAREVASFTGFYQDLWPFNTCLRDAFQSLLILTEFIYISQRNWQYEMRLFIN